MTYSAVTDLLSHLFVCSSVAGPDLKYCVIFVPLDPYPDFSGLCIRIQIEIVGISGSLSSHNPDPQFKMCRLKELFDA